MPDTTVRVEYIGAVQNFSEVTITGNQQVWRIGSSAFVETGRASQLVASGKFRSLANDPAMLPANQAKVGATPSGEGVVNVTAGDLIIFSVGPTGVIPTANSIGLAGQQGFGVGVCPVLPGGYAALPGTADPASDNYGNYTYVVDNSNSTVDALSPGQTLQESFNYSVRDIGGLIDTAVLTITIEGANDTPTASNDTGTALEAGGTRNGTPGANASGKPHRTHQARNRDEEKLHFLRDGGHHQPSPAGRTGRLETRPQAHPLFDGRAGLAAGKTVS